MPASGPPKEAWRNLLVTAGMLCVEWVTVLMQFNPYAINSQPNFPAAMFGAGSTRVGNLKIHPTLQPSSDTQTKM